MIKLFPLKQQKAEEETAAAEGKTKATAGQIRMQKDLSELTLGKGVELEFHKGPDSLMEFKVHVLPDDGMYKGGRFTFDVKVPQTYPHDPPKVLCETTVYHPNIDMEGHVCLKILREDWKPVLTINSVIYGLTFLMREPNSDHPMGEVRPLPRLRLRCMLPGAPPFAPTAPLLQEYRIDSALFWERGQKLYDAWKGARGAGKVWDGVDAIAVDTGKYDEDVLYLKSKSLQLWLFGLELPDTVVIFADSMAYVLSSPKKVAIVEQLMARRPDGAPFSLLCYTRNEADKDEANYRTLLEKLAGSMDGKTVATLLKEELQGDHASNWRKALAASGLAQVDLSPMLADLLCAKDDAEQALVKRAAFFSSQLLEQHLLPDLEAIVDEKKKKAHSALAAEVDDFITRSDMLQRLKIPQTKIPDPENLEMCYTPIIQSGGKYNLKPSAESNDDNVHDHVITVSLGGRYKSYCSNVGRTYIINPTKDQQRHYALLLEAQEAAIKALVPGRSAADAMQAAADVVKDRNPELLAKLTKNAGFGTGIEFRDANFVLNLKNTKPLRANMVCVVTLGLGGLANPEAPDAKGRTYALFVSDTVLVGDAGPEVLTSKCSKKWEDVSYQIQEEQPSRGNVRALRPEQLFEHLRRRGLHEGGHDLLRPGDQLREHQEELEKAVTEDAIRRLKRDGGGGGGAAGGRQGNQVPTAYPSPDAYPRDMSYTQTFVDVKAEAVLIPVYGTMVPFHISTIKNVTKSEEGNYTYLRINFNAAGQGFNAAKDAAPLMDTLKDLDSIREVTLRARDPRNLNNAFRLIKELRTRVMRRDKEDEEKQGLVEQEPLRVLSGMRVHRLRDVNMRPHPSGRKSQGELAIQANGVRYTSNKGERVDITFKNIRNAFFQPAQKEHLVLIHFHLHNGIMIGKKKHNDVQFYVEVIDQSTALRRWGYDPDELQKKERERMNNEFQSFAENMEEASELEFDIPYRELGFDGVANESNSYIMPTTNALVELIEPPWLVVNIPDIDIVHFERVVFGLTNFDMVIVFKDLKRDPVQVTTIDVQKLDQIKQWLDSCNIEFYEGTANLQWTAIMKHVRDDPLGFYAGNSWTFLDFKKGDSDESSEEEEEWSLRSFEPEDDGSEEEEDLDDDEEACSDEDLI